MRTLAIFLVQPGFLFSSWIFVIIFIRAGSKLSPNRPVTSHMPKNHMATFSDLFTPANEALLAQENERGQLILPCWVESRKLASQKHYFFLNYWPQEQELQGDGHRVLQQVLAREQGSSFKVFPSLASAYSFYSGPNHYNCSRWVVRVQRGDACEEVDLRHYGGKSAGAGFQNTERPLPRVLAYSSVPPELRPSQRKKLKSHRDRSPKRQPKLEEHKLRRPALVIDLTMDNDEEAPENNEHRRAKEDFGRCVMCDEDNTSTPVRCTEGHCFGWDCLRDYVKIEVEERKAWQISCPRTSWGECKGQICFLSADYETEPKLLRRLDLNVKRHQLEQANTPFVQCPGCGDCVLIGQSRLLNCEACSHSFCCGCLQPRCCCPTDELNAARAKVELVLQTALWGVACPNCGEVGQKDLQCTHVKCERCQTRFCYCCGKSQEMLRAEQPGLRDLFEHNVGFPARRASCPRYLEQMSKLSRANRRIGVDGCPPNASGALTWFHRQRTIEALAKTKRELGPELWAAVNRDWNGVSKYPWARRFIRAH